MSLVGLELNSTRARAVHGSGTGAPLPLALEEDSSELALALSLEGRSLVAGRHALATCRKSPHAVCVDFLPHIGGNRVWSCGRHRVDGVRALAVTCDVIAARLPKAHGLVLSIPTYLDDRQRAHLGQVSEKARWRSLATIAAPIAAAVAAFEHVQRGGIVLVGDVDGHAFTWSVVSMQDNRASLLETSPLMGCGRAAWLQRLIDGIAIRCVRTTRRDPRECGGAEQGLYDQLVDRLSTRPEGSRAEFIIQTSQWFHNLMLDAEELRGWCAPLATQVVASMMDVRALASEQGSLAAIVLTASAGRLPGLVAALEDQLHPPAVLRSTESSNDFGDGLLIEDLSSVRVHVLDADALVRVAHEVCGRVHRGEIAQGHYEEMTLPVGMGVDETGPARLHFRGHDHLIARTVFTLGRDPSCDLVFESALYPTVSARHCEIVLDRQVFLLRDRSRHGTLVNDCPVMQQTSLRAGDWIRLGPAGPLLRFLGRPGDPRTLVTA
jgi:hypothetical protein